MLNHNTSPHHLENSIAFLVTTQRQQQMPDRKTSPKRSLQKLPKILLPVSAERQRLNECAVNDLLDLEGIESDVCPNGQKFKNWRCWGPYVSDRAWGTVREDYSSFGNAWESFPFDHAIRRAYRWSEDGIGGICDSKQKICIAPAFWNEKDAFLKERFFGLANHEGNHGEDVKECYYYVDNTPTHSYMKMIYRYPQVSFPYQLLKEANANRNQNTSEYELTDALESEWRNGNYFDISIEYCKITPDDILCRIQSTNKSKQDKPIHILPQVWFRNTWSWPSEDDIQISAEEGPMGYNLSTKSKNFQEALKH